MKTGGSEPVSDGFVHEFRGNRRIHATANGADDAPFGTNNFANASNFLVDECFLNFPKSIQ
jgi:hypothetical protein